MNQIVNVLNCHSQKSVISQSTIVYLVELRRTRVRMATMSLVYKTAHVEMDTGLAQNQSALQPVSKTDNFFI